MDKKHKQKSRLLIVNDFEVLVLVKKGAKELSVEPFVLGQHDKPVAWILKFKKEN